MTLKSPPAKKLPWDFGSENRFLNFLRSGAFREAPGLILEAPGTLPDQISGGFCDAFRVVILRYFLAGCVGILSRIVGFRRGVAEIHTQPQ